MVRVLPVLVCLVVWSLPRSSHPDIAPRLGAASLTAAGALVASAATEVVDTQDSTWWRERQKRFQELAVCALSSANVTYLLLTGISGPGAVIGFSVSLLGVIVCL